MIGLLPRLVASRFVYFPLLALPGLYLLNREFIFGGDGPWNVEFVLNFLGNTAILLLITVLCFTPLRVLLPQSRLVAALNRHRRATGIACFLYAATHFLVFVRTSTGYENVIDDLSSFVYLQAGLAALLLLAVLAVTSNKLTVWLLRYPLWKLLHRLAYAAAALAFFHRAFGAEKADQFGTTLAMFAPLLVLEALRIGTQTVTGTAKAIHQATHQPAFKGWRKFRVARKVAENADITSIYLQPVRGRRLKAFRPGQYLTYEFPIPGQPDPAVRTYSLSDAPHPRHYRASIKRVPAPRDHPDLPPGLVSNFVHDTLKEGQILRVRAPAGEFWLDPAGHGPVVLIGSGIGVTPVLAMLKALAQRRWKREVWFFYGCRSRADGAFYDEMREAVAALPNGRLVICHSQAALEDAPECHHYEREQCSVAVLQRLLPHNRHHFYFCGPNPMMEAFHAGLLAWGVPEKRLHYEAFGPSSLSQKKLPKGVVASAKITFRRSKKTLQWDGSKASLLEFAESRGLHPKFGCRAGACGTCRVRLRAGEVAYAKQPSADPGANGCLLCVALPKGDLEIDA